jgi:hypothetical protein
MELSVLVAGLAESSKLDFFVLQLPQELFAFSVEFAARIARVLLFIHLPSLPLPFLQLDCVYFRDLRIQHHLDCCAWTSARA